MKFIVDTGFLVAVFYPHDAYHSWAVKELEKISTPLLTCEAVITETMHILRQYTTHGYQGFCASLRGSAYLEIPFRAAERLPNVLALLAQYADTPMDFADACLVQMVEEYNPAQAVVLTIDSDFWVYRAHQTKSIALIIPPDRRS